MSSIIDSSIYYKDTFKNLLFNNLDQLPESTFGQFLKYGALILSGFSFYFYFIASEKTRSFLLFIWACFVKPFTPTNRKVHNDHQNNLELFYKTQAKVYDTTREVLLQGRESAMKLAVAHLKTDQSSKKLIWIDIGGGTGLNIEKMDKEVAPIVDNFEAIYLIDLSTSLCEIAKQRVLDHGWNNVHIICGDACDFEIPHSEVDLITYSYSLSMIPLYHSAIDHASKFLKPDEGIICSVDFGVQSDSTSIGRINTLGGLVNRHVPWIYRTFWRIWFECDKVFLDPSRREYLEYKFGTLKSINCYNTTLGKIPYYIWLGVNKQHDSQLMYRFNQLATESPYLAPIEPKKSNAVIDAPTSKALEAALDNVKKGLPYPSLFYQKKTWRVYYDELSEDYECFKNQYIYAFTWEDPREDAKILNLSSKDTVLAITSAGDNILSYASLGSNAPKRIHGVDLNPCQGHLVELKLAALSTLSHEETWKLFGQGKIENFQELLISKLAPYLSSNAFQYWMDKGPKTFDINGAGLYDTGSTRWALRLARYVFKLTGLSSKVEELCNAKTLIEQKEIWNNSIRPILYSAVVGKIFVGNPIFLWKALGVPANQAAMMDSSILQYIIDTLDPIVGRSLISSDNYFYYLTLKNHYSPKNCPDYLTKQGFKQLTKKAPNSPLDGIRLHTDYLNNVLARLTKKTISIAVIMDHMDWFDPEGTDVDNEIDALHSALCDGGRVMLRTAALVPWYIKNFEKKGFKCHAAATRHSGTSIDRVNMYASTWICTKIGNKKERQMSTLTLNKD
ncbi:Ubiquinone/menaquinone biosynthesis methyltransferase [Wickerhamomyces ciferrii]|uniref:Ubiquinone/menaquinone biosynthesis methyltransferase n=1 Tax=Wickerhamomyces ciferrii (strain ATCC 14091 / BCRC 22168 / CBS 111 / JCM 3599 / NBRC 0793 / NRRL Y-1031 F-60-10) TaxID=1206466 RepID=K0KQC4_WICCF|nr:Ubiquinone/menaquinone biosynthesis methyltransferase [Wickerhamomyces ciferrii]CCH45246.1 Ubiquinone/menaquinone biosynthesis methyltransferase [Wickerhamomyces ciferrii]